MTATSMRCSPHIRNSRGARWIPARPATAAGDVPDTEKPGKMRRENHCDYCHVIHVNQKRDVKETLNRYGADYLAAGRGAKAVKALASKDSDGDGFSNEAEFLKGTNPGDSGKQSIGSHRPEQNLYRGGNQNNVAGGKRNRFCKHHKEQVGRFLQRIPGEQGVRIAAGRRYCGCRGQRGFHFSRRL